MSEVTRKAVSLTQAKTLYDDLRQRIESGAGAATLAETQTIIDNYGIDEEDEGMVVDATFGSVIGEAWFKTDMDAADIATAFMSGKNVIIHCVGTEESKSFSVSDTYLQMVGYVPEVTRDQNTYPDNFLFVTSGGICHSPAFSFNLLTSTHVGSDGKLYIDVYVD